jgi:ATP-dependent metalloprotease FtsH
MTRASGEAMSLSSGVVFPEHVLLGIFKISELTAEEIAPTSKHKAVTTRDLRLIRERLSDMKIHPGQAREKLRRIIRSEPPTGDAEALMQKLFEGAANFAKKAKRDLIYSMDILTALIQGPSPAINAALNINPKKENENDGKDDGAKPLEEETGVAFLSSLTKRVRDTRYTLLEKVYGQDHAVHAFVEGMFSAEVLAAADATRVRPRAIFVFAGPPGVGKTYLAEQAAAALGFPFKRFDMSGYSDHQAHIQLIGFAPSFKEAKRGTLTGFVKDNPKSVLLFDEIEKASANAIQLFLQVLDAGRLHDDYMDKDIAFKDTYIIFTTNAGRALYEDSRSYVAAGLPRQTILNALETDTQPTTGKPFFPRAILSRLSTGYLMMFNHLDALDLENVCDKELKRCGELLETQYNLFAVFDDLLPTILLFSEGGQVDARNIRARAETFFKNELFKLCRLWGENIEAALGRLEKISFSVDADNLPKNVAGLFHSPDKIQILVYGDAVFASRLRKAAPDITVLDAMEPEEAFALLAKNNPSFVLLKLMGEVPDRRVSMATRLTVDETLGGYETINAFDNIPMGAKSLNEIRSFFKELRERMPELPLYLLENDGFYIDAELEGAFVMAGARGKLIALSPNLSVFIEELNRVAGRLHLQNMAATLAVERKGLTFETAPIPSPDKSEVVIRIRELDIRRTPDAGDTDVLLEDAQKPSVKFADVIGAESAKEELGFFVQYLKNPKNFAARGLKPPKGVLLHGPPGTGKTLLAKAMAGESEVAFIPAAASSFVTKWQGSGPESVRTLFQRARRYAPSVIFIDEIDAIGRSRGGPSSGHGEEMALNALLTEMDGFSFDSKRPVFVLAATNLPVEEGDGGMVVIDPALVRRFDRKILVDLPAKDDRRRYLDYALAKHPNHEVTDIMLQSLAERSGGLSLANLESVIELAVRNSIKRSTNLNNEILEEAFELFRHGEEKNWGREYMERVARHESGHAYLCYLSGETPSYLTIVSRGRHGGYMQHANDESSPQLTKEGMLARVRVALGGRAAEISYYGSEDGLSTGASGDLEISTKMVKAMLTRYGMDKKFGLAVISSEESAIGPLAAVLRREVNAILDQQMELAIDLIRDGKEKIDKLVAALLEKNKLTKEEMEAILA